jgi:hypothetical protein
MMHVLVADFNWHLLDGSHVGQLTKDLELVSPSPKFYTLMTSRRLNRQTGLGGCPAPRTNQTIDVPDPSGDPTFGPRIDSALY